MGKEINSNKENKDSQICRCGNTIGITVPMYIDDDDDYICKECYDKGVEEAFIEKHIDTFEKFYIKGLKKIVIRLIELKLEFWNKGNQGKGTMRAHLHGKSDGIEKALTVIDGFTNFNKEIHRLIDDSRK